MALEGLTIRSLMAMFGGFAVTVAASAVVSLHLPVGRADAMLSGGLLFPIFWVAIMALVYAATSNRSAAIGLGASFAGLMLLCAVNWI